MKIENAVVLVTGANRGIGTAFVHEALRRGAKRVYAGAREPLALTALEREGAGRVIVLKLDVTDPQQVAAAAATATDVTIVINNAGVMNGHGVLSAPDLSAAQHEMDVNYFGTMSVARAFLPALRTAGGGAIVNMLSFLSLVTLPSVGTYSASKYAALALTRSIRAEAAAGKTLVVASMPVQVDTDMGAAMPEPRLTVGEVVSETLDAVERGDEDVFPGELTRGAAAAFTADPKGLQANMSRNLPR